MKSVEKTTRQSFWSARASYQVTLTVIVTALLGVFALTIAGCGGTPPKVKGLYPGMSIEQARKAIGEYVYEEQETSDGGTILRLAATANQELDNEFEREMDGLKRVLSEISGKDMVRANSDGQVIAITMSGKTAAHLFGSGNMNGRTFTQQFRKAYGTPEFSHLQDKTPNSTYALDANFARHWGIPEYDTLDIYTCMGDDWMIEIRAVAEEVDSFAYTTLSAAAGSFD